MRNSLEVYKGGRERVRERRERGSEKTWRRGENQTLTVYKARGTRVRVRRKRVKWLGGKACQHTMQEKRERERGGGETVSNIQLCICTAVCLHCQHFIVSV